MMAVPPMQKYAQATAAFALPSDTQYQDPLYPHSWPSFPVDVGAGVGVDVDFVSNIDAPWSLAPWSSLPHAQLDFAPLPDYYDPGVAGFEPLSVYAQAAPFKAEPVKPELGPWTSASASTLVATPMERHVRSDAAYPLPWTWRSPEPWHSTNTCQPMPPAPAPAPAPVPQYWTPPVTPQHRLPCTSPATAGDYLPLAAAYGPSDQDRRPNTAPPLHVSAEPQQLVAPWPLLVDTPLPNVRPAHGTAPSPLVTVRQQHLATSSPRALPSPHTTAPLPPLPPPSPPGRTIPLLLPPPPPLGRATPLPLLAPSPMGQPAPLTLPPSLPLVQTTPLLLSNELAGPPSARPAPPTLPIRPTKRQRGLPLRIPPGPRFLETLFAQHGRTIRPCDRAYLDIRSARYTCDQAEAVRHLVAQSAKRFHDQVAMLAELRGLAAPAGIKVVCVSSSEGGMKLDVALGYLKTGLGRSKSTDRAAVEAELSSGVMRVTEPAPSRPMNCNFIFMSRRRSQIGKLFLDFMTDRTSQILGEEWRQLDREERNYWMDLWEEYSAEFRRMFPTYRWRKSRSAIPER